jgi:hypothetical protein
MSMFSDLARFFVAAPSLIQLAAYRPPTKLQRRAAALLHKHREQGLTEEEQVEFDEFMHAEILMRLVKARARTQMNSNQ